MSLPFRMVKAQGTLRLTTQRGDVFVQKNAMVTLRHATGKWGLAFRTDSGAFGNFDLSSEEWRLCAIKKLKSNNKKGRSILLENTSADSYIKSIQLSFEITDESDSGAAFTALLRVVWE